MLVGVVDPGKGAKISRSWVRLSYIHQESFSTPVTEELREKLRNKAIFTSKSGRIKRRKTGWAKYFFLKKSTKYLKTPARPFIEPLMRVNRAEIENNLKTNYLKKLAGDRIGSSQYQAWSSYSFLNGHDCPEKPDPETRFMMMPTLQDLVR